eukprot:symbB.v1.2.008775.t1/scaffold514.1/size193457/1
MQRKLPAIHFVLLYVLGILELMAFPLLGAGTFSMAPDEKRHGNNKILSIQALFFGAMSGAIVMTLQVIYELWKPFGGAYTVDTALSRMVAGLEEELRVRKALWQPNDAAPAPATAAHWDSEQSSQNFGRCAMLLRSNKRSDDIEEDNATLKQLHESLQELYRRLQEERDALKRRLRHDQAEIDEVLRRTQGELARLREQLRSKCRECEELQHQALSPQELTRWRRRLEEELREAELEPIRRQLEGQIAEAQ